jgi:hypothetical protein
MPYWLFPTDYTLKQVSTDCITPPTILHALHAGTCDSLAYKYSLQTQQSSCETQIMESETVCETLDTNSTVTQLIPEKTSLYVTMETWT